MTLIAVGKVVMLTEVVVLVKVALLEMLFVEVMLETVPFMKVVLVDVALVDVMLFEALVKLLKYPTRAMIRLFDMTMKLLRAGTVPKKMLDTAAPLGRKPAPLIET